MGHFKKRKRSESYSMKYQNDKALRDNHNTMYIEPSSMFPGQYEVTHANWGVYRGPKEHAEKIYQAFLGTGLNPSIAKRRTGEYLK